MIIPIIWILLESLTLSLISVLLSSLLVIIVYGLIKSTDNVKLSGTTTFICTFITAIIMNFYLLFHNQEWFGQDLFISIWFKLSFYFTASLIYTLLFSRTKFHTE